MDTALDAHPCDREYKIRLLVLQGTLIEARLDVGQRNE